MFVKIQYGKVIMLNTNHELTIKYFLRNEDQITPNSKFVQNVVGVTLSVHQHKNIPVCRHLGEVLPKLTELLFQGFEAEP